VVHEIGQRPDQERTLDERLGSAKLLGERLVGDVEVCREFLQRLLLCHLVVAAPRGLHERLVLALRAAVSPGRRARNGEMELGRCVGSSHRATAFVPSGVAVEAPTRTAVYSAPDDSRVASSTVYSCSVYRWRLNAWRDTVIPVRA
jgi:hypothetical protein